MNKETAWENVYKAIRREDVVLWMGAGCSRYAGYKVGSEFSELLYSQLPKDHLSKSLSNNLPEVSSEFEKLYGRERLNELIAREYIEKVPQSTKHHDKLSKIPHIKTTITTNYDRLIEGAFGDNCQLAFDDASLISLDAKKNVVLKPHGHLSDISGCVITKEDFSRVDLNRNIWTVIGERIISKIQIVVGFALGDPDVNAVFDKIWKNITHIKKDAYIIAPDLSGKQINRLENFGFIYIDGTFEDFIERITTEVNANVITDCRTGMTSPDVLTKMGQHYGFKPVVSGTIIKGFAGINDQPFNATMSLKLKREPIFKRDFVDFVSGKRFGNLEIPANILDEISIKFGELDFLNKKDSSVTLFMESKPKLSVSFNIRFEDGYERMLMADVFGSRHLVQVNVDLKQGLLTLKARSNKRKREINITANLEERKEYSTCLEEIDFYNLVWRLYSGKHFTIFLDNNQKITKRITTGQSTADRAWHNLLFFEELRKIEMLANVRFSKIDIVDQDMARYVNTILRSLEGKPIEHHWDEELKVTFAPEGIASLKERSYEPGNIQLHANEKEIVDLYGEQIVLGYRYVDFIDMQLVNLTDIISGNSDRGIFKSKTQKIIRKYLSYPPELPMVS